MATYTYPITDFTGNLNFSQFHCEIADSSITKVLEGVTSDGVDVNVIFQSTLTTGEKNTLDNLVLSYSEVITVNSKTIFIKDIKPMGTDGGTFTSGAWRTRDLNTLEPPNPRCVTLNSNQFTLKPGSYVILVTCPGYRVGNHQAALYNITTSSYVSYGTSQYSYIFTNVVSSFSVIDYRVKLTEKTTYEVRHRSTSSNFAGFGLSAGVGDIEVYTVVKIKRSS